MERNIFYLVAFFTLGLNTPVTCQTESGQNSFSGLQNTLNQFVESASETYESLKQQYNEYIRIGMLLGSDIRMEMNSEQGWTHDAFVKGILNLYKAPHEGSLYAEFDWQNMSESMRLKSSEYITGVNILGNQFTKKNKAQDFNMYIDPLGYWYIPSGELKGWGSDANYLRVNPIGGMSNVAKMLEVGIQAAIDSKVTEMLDFLGYMVLVEGNNPGLQKVIPPEVKKIFVEGESMPWSSCCEWQGEGVTGLLKEYLASMVKLQFEQISMLPAFIHFAFIISPTAVRSSFNVSEETITSDGQVLATRMTVLSGADAGYLIVFDQYGRLVHLRDTDGSTADYWYDKDVTVTIPPAAVINMDVLMQLSQPGISDK